MRVEHLAPGFELQDLTAGSLAVAGISGLGRDEADWQSEVSQLLIDGLGIKMPALEILSLDEVRELVGRERHCALTAEVGETLGPQNKDFAHLAGLAAQARFCIWIHLNGFEVSSGEWQGPEYEKTSSYNCSSGQWEEQESFRGYSSNRSTYRRASALIFIYYLERNVPVLVAQGSSNDYFHSSALGPYGYPPFPVWPGGSGAVEPLAAMAAKALAKVPATKVARR